MLPIVMSIIVSSCATFTFSENDTNAAITTTTSDTTSEKPKDIKRDVDSVVIIKNDEEFNSPEPESDRQAINEDHQALLDQMKIAGEFIQAYNAATDKKAFLRQKAANYVDATSGELIKNIVKAYGGMNVELALNIDEHFKKFKPTGKILIPLSPNNPNVASFIQSGMSAGTNDRYIAHLGAGVRFYPEASSLEEVGSYMVGTNVFLDHDVKRKHNRASIGVEYMNDKDIRLSANAYKALSDWKNSPDYEKGFAEEKAASGFDTTLQYAITRQIIVKAGFAKWFGDDVSVFGDPRKLEKDPSVYSAELEYSPVPAVTLGYKHERTNNGSKNNSVNLSVSVPLSSEALYESFNPRAVNMASGNDLKSSRSMFVERDYKMPLKYRAKEGAFHIKYNGQPGDNLYLFKVTDGLDRDASFVPVTVIPDNPCVVFSNNGLYTTDAQGFFVAKVVKSCTTETMITVIVGKTAERFKIQIQNLSFNIEAHSDDIERQDTSDVVVKLESPSQEPLEIKWSLDGTGKLSNCDETIQTEAHATYEPDVSITEDHSVVVKATVQRKLLATKIRVKVYGAGDGDLSAGKDAIEGTEVIPVIYKNLKAGSTTKFKIEGNGRLISSADGTDLKTELDVIVDKDGQAIVYVKADDVDEGSITVRAETADPNSTPETQIKVISYIPVVVLPDYPVNPSDDFEVTISGLKPGTQLKLTDADHAKIKSDKTVTVDESGTVKAIYTASNEFYKGQIKGIEATYYRNVDNSALTKTLDAVDVKEYTPALTPVTQTFTGNDTVIIKLSGGYKGIDIIWSDNPGLSDKQTKFDENGEATAKFTGQPPYSGTEVISATSFGKTETISFDYTNYTPELTVEQGIDYKVAYPVTITGLMPNTAVHLSTDNSHVSLSEATMNTGNNGSITFNVEPVSDFTVHSFNIKAVYQKNSAETIELIEDVTMKNYVLSISSDKSSIVGNDTFTVTFSGGKENEQIEWSLQGNGHLESYDDSFNSSGAASAVIKGINPYSGNIAVTASSMAVTKTANISLSALEIKETNTGAISAKGTSTVSFTDGVTGETVNFSITGDGSLSTNTSTFDESGKASVVVTGIFPYAENIKVTASTTYGKYATSEIAISSPNISVSNSGAISAKGTSTVTVSGGIPGESVSFSKSGNGSLSASSATFNNEGKASVTVTGTSPYSGTITVTATTSYSKSASTNIGISSPNISVTNSGAINGTGSNVVTVSGGVPGESVGWSYSSTYMTGSCDSTFNSSGVARCTFYGRGNVPSGSVTTETTKTLTSSDTYTGTWSSSGGISGGNGTWNYNGYTLKNANNSFSITNVSYSAQGCTVNPKVEVISQTTSNVSFKLGGTVFCNAGGASGGGGIISFKVSTTATVVETSGSGTGSVNESVSISTNYGKTGSTSFNVNH